MHVLNTIHSLFYASLKLSLVDFNQREGDATQLHQQHLRIFQAILAQDADRARSAMLDHLSAVDTKIEKILREGLSG
jgi:GntR family transcriptional repressor for pyruvate dehydrogenase complex